MPRGPSPLALPAVRLRSRRICLCALSLGLGLAASPSVHAGDPLNSNDKPENSEVSGKGSRKQNAPHTEFNFVPIAGGSTDIGIGGGFFANLVRLKPGFLPYFWGLESAGLITFKPGNDGGVVVPYTDLFVKLTVPRLFGAPLRLEIRPSYTAETTILYSGLGNSSSPVLPPGKSKSYGEFGRIHPQLDLDLRFKIVDHFSGRVGARYIQNWLRAAADSRLTADMTGGSSELQGLLGSTAPHAVILLKVGLQWDTRDNEASTNQGLLNTLDLRVSPGGSEAFPYRYGEATLNLRFFVPIRTPLVTLAGRLVGNVLFGEVPFYELSRFDDTYALGGTNGVRGIPAGRFAGKVKLFGNVELRADLVAFHALGKPFVFGAVVFFDAGRLWTDFSAHPVLDGKGLGLHTGEGGGLRLQSGSAFVLRADVAWSPDAGSMGGYFSAGQMF